MNDFKQKIAAQVYFSCKKRTLIKSAILLQSSRWFKKNAIIESKKIT